MKTNVALIIWSIMAFGTAIAADVADAIPGVLSFLLSLVASVVFIFSITDILRKKERAKRDEETYAGSFLTKPSVKVEPDLSRLPGTFCPDCGQRSIYFAAQRGFSLKTGLPDYHSIVGCPDWDRDYEAYQQERASRIVGFISPIGWSAGPGVIACGNVALGPYEPVTKHEHDETQAELECIRCLMDMEKMGVLSKYDVSERIAKLFNVKPE